MGIAFILLSASTFAQSDESGTLVMVARTPDGIVLAVDSAITVHGIPTTNGRRKLIDVGQYGACAIEGWSGNQESGDDLSEKVRSWLRANPGVSGMDAIKGIQNIAVASWNSEGYKIGQLPLNRTVGVDITNILCGDMLSTGPAILEVQTRVGSDGSAKPSDPSIRIL